MAHYRVVFTGEFDSRIGRDQCIQTLAGKMGKDEQAVARQFFDNPPRTVLRTSRKSEARRAVTLFGKAGAVLEIQTGSGTGPASTQPAATQSKRSWRLTGLMVLLLAVLAGAAWYTTPLWYTDEQTELAHAEAAFATDDLIALGFVDVRRSVAIERRFLGEQDTDALPGADTKSFLSQLMQQGINPRESVDSVLLAGYANEGEALPQLQAAAMVTGRFDPRAIRDFIAQRYQAVPGDSESNLVHFTMVNEQTCEQSGAIAVHVASDRLVVAPENRIRTLLTRLGASATEERNLEQWRRFRSGRLASIGLLAPGKVLDASGDLGRMVVGKHQSQLEDIEALFLGLGASVMPPGMLMTAAVSSPDKARQQSRKADLDDVLSAATDRMEQMSPDAARLMSHIEPFHSGDELGATVSLNDQFMEDIGTLAKAGLDAMLQPVGLSADTAGNAPVTEQVEKNPRVFHDRVDPAQIPPFDDIDQDVDDLAWQQGPFALRVTELGKSEEEGSLPYITLQLEARQLGNVPDRGTWGQLRVTEVLDLEGNPVMSKPECGQNRGQDPAWLTKVFGASFFRDGEFVQYPAHQVKKQVHLSEDTSPLAIGEVRGIVEARIPVQVSRHRVSAPLAGKFVEAAGSRVLLSKSSEGQLNYETSGEHERILAVRALNDQGQVLKSPGGSSMGRLLGSGEHHSRDVQGNPAQVEVFIAERWQSLQHEFSLQSPSPVLSGGVGNAPLIEAAGEGEIKEALELPVPPEAGEFFQQPMSSVDSGPLKVSLERLQSGGFYPFFATLDVRTALIPGLDQNMAAGRFQLTSVTDDQGNDHPVTLSVPFALGQDGMMVNGVYQKSSRKPWLEGEVSLVYPDYKGSQPVSLSGQVELLPVREIRKYEITRPEFGTSYNRGDVSVTPESLGSQGYSLLVTSGAGQLVALEVLNSGGEKVGVGSFVFSGEQTDSGMRHRVSVSDRPHVLVLHVATDTMEAGYPFTIEVD